MRAGGILSWSKQKSIEKLSSITPIDIDDIETRFKGESFGYLKPLDLGLNSNVRKNKTGEEVGLDDDKEPRSYPVGYRFEMPADDEFDPKIFL